MAIDTDAKVLKWLKQFGYLSKADPNVEDVLAAVVKMQEVYGLTTDGFAGPITRRAMNMFRCSWGDSDILMETNPNALTDDTKKWSKTNLTFAVDPAMVLADDRLTCMTIIRAGFSHYAPLTGLTFTESPDYQSADIRISAAARTSGMDGIGNILALSDMPNGQYDRPLRTVFDKDEPWNLNPVGPGIILQSVWMHELGHLLGLSHSSNPNDLMSPYYAPTVLYPQRQDRQRLAALYGVPFIEGADSNKLEVGAYTLTGVLVVRHDGGIALNLRDIVSA